MGDDVTVVGVDSAAAARATLARDPDFDLVLLDLALGDADGFDVLVEFRAAYPAVPVVVVSASERTSDVIRAIDAGAMGFVPKRSSNAALHEALRMVMSGGCTCRLSMLGLEFGRAAARGDTVPAVCAPVRQHARAEPRPARAHQKLPAGRIGLTPRQAEVLALLLQGLPNKLIARQLNLSVETVKDHVAAVLRALGVSSRTQAVLAVSQMTQGQGGFAGARPRADTALSDSRCAGPSRRRRRRRGAAAGAARRRPHPRAVRADAGHAGRQLIGMVLMAAIFWPLAEPVRCSAGRRGGAAWLLRLAHYLRFSPHARRRRRHAAALAPQLAALVLAQGAHVGRGGVAVLGPGHALPPLALILIVYSLLPGLGAAAGDPAEVFLVFLSLVLTPTIVRIASDTSSPGTWQLAVILTLLFGITC